MSNVDNLEQKIGNLQLGLDETSGAITKVTKKIGPAVPPKPKKLSPQVS